MKIILCAFFILATLIAGAQKLDTTVKMNAQGYRVQSPNKEDNNNVSIDGIKLDNSLKQVNFEVKGKITKVAIDDLTDDGNPDIILCVYNGQDNAIGNVVGITYDKTEKSLKPIIFNDIYSDPKLREGYKGHDVFSLVIGTLMRKFPIYLPNDAPDKPTGGLRTVQYKATIGERGFYTFKVLRTFDTKPEE